MYLPAHFREDRPEVLHEIVRRYSFATLVSHDADGALIASQLPFLFDAAENRLRSHMARANPHWRGFDVGGGEAMVIFRGPHAYISPSWYESKLQVPTWNYVTVHAYGVPRIVEDDEVRAIVTETVKQYESPRPQPWPMPLPEEYIANLLRGIVGFEMQITRVEGKLKLSQNRSKPDAEGAMTALERGDDQVGRELAEWMRRVERK
jgi:transcriptional regulator